MHPRRIFDLGVVLRVSSPTHTASTHSSPTLCSSPILPQSFRRLLFSFFLSFAQLRRPHLSLFSVLAFFFLPKWIVKSVSQKAETEYRIRSLFFFSLQRILESVSEEAETEPRICFGVFFAFSPKRMRYWV